jgi:hypothetical protein
MKLSSVIQVIVTALIMSFLIFPHTGCSKEKSGLSIKPEIYEYSPYMSSTPGIPLVAVFTRDLTNKNYVYHWIAKEGKFLKWQNSASGMGRIEVLDDDIKTNENKVYWTVDPDHEINAETFDVDLSIEELSTGKVMYEARIEIKQTELLYFVIENED